MKYPLIFGQGVTVADPSNGLFTPMAGSSVLHVDASMMRNGDRPYHPELQYLALLQELVDKTEGAVRDDRTGTGTFSVFGRQIRFDLEAGFPLLTTKKLFTKGIVAELLWMLAGDTNIKALVDQGVHIWDEWADENGELGPVYGEQWRNWTVGYFFDLEETKHGQRKVLREPMLVDQISQLIDNLKTRPNDRGHVVSAWNVAAIPHMKLRPCHCLMQFYVENGKLSCQLYQRSADIFLGVPFNIASYALLTHLIAREVGLGVGEFVHTFGDLHLYSNHVEQAKVQLTRTPYPFPTLLLDTESSLFEIKTPDVKFCDYDAHPPIKAEVSV